jgi:hypothetical protein
VKELHFSPLLAAVEDRWKTSRKERGWVANQLYWTNILNIQTLCKIYLWFRMEISINEHLISGRIFIPSDSSCLLERANRRRLTGHFLLYAAIIEGVLSRVVRAFAHDCCCCCFYLSLYKTWSKPAAAAAAQNGLARPLTTRGGGGGRYIQGWHNKHWEASYIVKSANKWETNVLHTQSKIQPGSGCTSVQKAAPL